MSGQLMNTHRGLARKDGDLTADIQCSTYRRIHRLICGNVD